VFAFTDTRAAVEVAFTDRRGGIRGGPYASLDLGEPRRELSDDGALRGGDLESRVAALEENLDAVAYALARGAEPVGDNPFILPPGTPLPTVVRMRQVHGKDVHVVDPDWLAAGRRVRDTEPPAADALVTATVGVALVVRVADCVPVLLADVDTGIVGAAHAGRNGLVAGIVPETVTAMRRLGAGRLVGWVGPHICGRCYEVPAALRDEVAAVVPQAYGETSWGTPAVDVGAGVVAQLRAADVDVVDASRCTLEDEDLFSHRGHDRERLAGLVWVRP
jgi:polyphenol oxidase